MAKATAKRSTKQTAKQPVQTPSVLTQLYNRGVAVYEAAIAAGKTEDEADAEARKAMGYK